MEGHILRSDASSQRDFNDGFIVKQKNPNLVTAPTGVQANESGCFDCNICLDTAHDPVVTLCGHLFCWPCIYKWLHQNNCPVCKAEVTIASLVPLYGRGPSSTSSSKKQESTEMIPCRPSPSTLTNPITYGSSLNPRLQQRQTLSPSFHTHQYYPRGFTTMESTDLANAVMMNLLYPVIGMFGDMVYTRIFGTFTNTIAAQPYQSQRMMQNEKSLHRVSIFLCCCIFLCLVFF